MILVCVTLLVLSSLGYADNDKVKKGDGDAVQLDRSFAVPTHKMSPHIQGRIRRTEPDAIVYGSEISPDDFTRLVREAKGDKEKFLKSIAKLSKDRLEIIKKTERAEAKVKHLERVKKDKKEKK